MAGDQWFGVRCLFRIELPPEVRDPAKYPGSVFEERITVWRAGSIDEAIERAEAEAEEYAEGGTEFLGYSQAYKMYDGPGEGSEVFSLMRESELASSDYIDRFFDTGGERQQG